MPLSSRSLVLTALLVACKPVAIEDEVDEDTGVVEDHGVAEGDYFPFEPPQALIVAPATARSGQAIELDGSRSYDPQGLPIVSWDWECSDGTTSDQATFTVTFDSPGRVDCELVVTSDSGLDDLATTDVDVHLLEVADWTFMVFLNGDNNLEINALDDANEMEQVGSTDEVHVVVQLDRSHRYTNADGNWRGARRYRIEADGDTGHISSPVLDDLGTTDSGSADTVIDFVEWAASSFPAERYALVMWDHGWGWDAARSGLRSKGLSEDEGAGTEISVAEGDYERLLQAAVESTGGRLDVVAMDACLMGSWEVAHVTAPYADVYVSSQATVGLDGFPYDTLLTGLVAEPGQDALALGDLIAATYIAEAEYDSTISVVDLSRMEQLDAAVDALAVAMSDSGQASALLGTARNAQEFEWGWGDDHDLGHFAQLVHSRGATPQGVKDAATALLSAYSLGITTNHTTGGGVSDASGLSIYTPTYWFDSTYLEGTWSENTHWDEFLDDAL